MNIKQQQFEMKQRQQAEKHASDLAAKGATLGAELQTKRALTGADLATTRATTTADLLAKGARTGADIRAVKIKAEAAPKKNDD
jgi:hypothetical protein